MAVGVKLSDGREFLTKTIISNVTRLATFATGCHHFLWRFEQLEVPDIRSFFTMIVASISDINFSKNGRHIFSHDYQGSTGRGT
ncbi:serine/threonine protein phosphatase 2A 55 kDa regulatory subunit B beta isoform-like [Tripterygium wilfordii]|uniref:serine/threonine protein phosphatase 2A 55 kDa regulatory subunit B beta isoform-like n=1 Tax=Tripterygium wilfordii TaxID=458696 RepID=UPI0018F855E0|nr:serine/threonine protein phosphatase 2A 55 kDa regulatory subunit B beta isoform-like [Tripterygium wilfordii]XP_038706298.1 serine/threonine protein phosphatase 2A 55 kDa regulatory subunit B beta isoform-like [Tripterygium wilfordii]XP_038706299.1 serine/threonine protein phosphatase 2A 55 kDa regulatory subunit B beta isoform-like [Tripterygium wilfordii]XP_038706300.1 serine/threonine protein phosphatase 2A 55 kDa regulatory subunit B beta isoform-like [Tripterygium wilfordii]XP_03870630